MRYKPLKVLLLCVGVVVSIPLLTVSVWFAYMVIYHTYKDYATKVVEYKLVAELDIDTWAEESSLEYIHAKKVFCEIIFSNDEWAHYLKADRPLNLRGKEVFLVTVGAPLAETKHVYNRGYLTPRRDEYYQQDFSLSRDYTGRIYVYTFSIKGLRAPGYR